MLFYLPYYNNIYFHTELKTDFRKNYLTKNVFHSYILSLDILFQNKTYLLSIL